MIIAEGRLSLHWYSPVTHGDQLVDLHHECFPDEDWKKIDFGFFTAKSNKGNVIKVLTDETKTVYGAMLYTLEDHDVCRIRRVSVLEDFRRQGLGSFMLNSLIGPNSPMRRRLVVARVRENNPGACRFLESMDFKFDPKKPRSKSRDGYDLYEFQFQK